MPIVCYRSTMDDTTRPIHFLYRGRPVKVQGLPPTTTVLSWLREHAGCTGTKEGCNEGDCGACMVAVAELQGDGHLQLRNLNACLMFLPTLDGKALFTVEDVSDNDGTLHPVQQAMVDHHGSQCGFCTPGFVMTVWTQWENLRPSSRCSTGEVSRNGNDQGLDGRPCTRQDWADALAGNLCRCTGYRPILDAAQASQTMNGPRLDRAALAASLQSLNGAATVAQAGPSPALSYCAFDAAQGENRRFSAPRNSDELAEELTQHPHARILGGATDIGLWTNKAHRDVGHLVYTGQARDLCTVQEINGMLCIGGAATLEDAWGALALRWPVLGDLWRRFASPPVRHAGTLAGNVANGSPIGDGPPVLMALQASLVLRQGQRRRTVRLEDFYLGYQRNALEPGEFIEWIEVPLPHEGQVLRAWKISKRYDSDISAVCAAFALAHPASPAGEATHPGSGGSKPSGVVMAFGGMAATVKRATSAERALMAHGWCEAGVRAAKAALINDFQPLSDLRATAAYRMEVAQALVQKWWMSVGPDSRLAGSAAADEGRPRLEVWR